MLEAPSEPRAKTSIRPSALLPTSSGRSSRRRDQPLQPPPGASAQLCQRAPSLPRAKISRRPSAFVATLIRSIQPPSECQPLQPLWARLPQMPQAPSPPAREDMVPLALVVAITVAGPAARVRIRDHRGPSMCRSCPRLTWRNPATPSTPAGTSTFSCCANHARSIAAEACCDPHCVSVKSLRTSRMVLPEPRELIAAMPISTGPRQMASLRMLDVFASTVSAAVVVDRRPDGPIGHLAVQRLRCRRLPNPWRVPSEWPPAQR